MFKRFIFLFSVLVLFSSLVFGEFVGADREEKSVDIGKIYVEEKQSEIINGLNTNIMSSTVIKGKILEAGSKANVADAVKEAPGVYFQKAGIIGFSAGSSAPSVLKIRGLGELPNPGILVVVDDRPQYIGIWRHPLLDTLSLDSVESIEVIKGPSGVELGNQATAGAIVINTKKLEKEGYKLTLNSGIGNYWTQDYFANALANYFNFDVSLSGGYKSTNGARQNSDSYQQNYHGHIGYSLNEFYFAINGDYSFIRSFNPGPVTAINWDREQEAVETLQRDGDVRVKYENNEMKTQIIAFTDSGHNNFLKTYNLFLGKLIDGSYNRYQNYGVRFINEWYLFPANITKLGFDWQYFGGYFDSRVPTPARKIEERYENDYAPYFSFSQDIGIFGIYLGTRYGINNKWGQEIVPQFGLKVALLKDFVMHINLSKGYKTPAMGTVIWSTYDELKPENFWQYETGLEAKLFDLINYSVTVYQTEGSNLLQTDPVDGKLKNTGFILLRGVEAGIDTQIFDKIKLGTNLCYTDPREKTARFAYLTGKVYSNIDIINNLSVKLETEIARDRFDADFRNQQLEEYAIVNSSVNYSVLLNTVETNFYLDIENMFDRKYQVKTGYPCPGFLIKGGLLIKI